MKNKIFVLGLLMLVYDVGISSGHTNINIDNVRDFGTIPEDGINDFVALRKAAEYCHNNEGSTLMIPEGVYDVIDKLIRTKIKNITIYEKN
jgi:hypothetical protein